MNHVLARWNSLDPDAAAAALLPCCGSRAWAEELAARRPIADEAGLLAESSAIWQALPEQAWQQAFDSHPRIGEQQAQGQATAQSLLSSAKEQSVALAADEAAKLALKDGNRRYEARFGRIFIICASGRSASEILKALELRMNNDAATELLEAAAQQRQITALRLKRWLEAESMGISTHLLDTALGRPAAGVPASLARLTGGAWTSLNEAVTDADGRCKYLLPEGEPLEPGVYRVHFATARYYEAQGLQGLYPYVEIVFEIADASAHYHIPLLLTANGFTTYRGS
jgi:2-oxo-4-hydroxy-4-carboxy-5-ureidoimidazoline decarboxylase